MNLTLLAFKKINFVGKSELILTLLKRFCTERRLHGITMSGTCDRRETPGTDGVCDARSGTAVFQIEIDEEPSSEQEQTINSRGVLKSWLAHSTRTD